MESEPTKMVTTEPLTPQEKRVQRLTLIGSGFFTLCFVTLCMGILFPIQIGFQLITGWSQYLVRTLSALSIPVGQTLWFLFVWGLFTWGLHRGCQKWSRQKQETESAVAWRKRWTLSLSTLCLLLAWSGICVISVAHQTWWMLTRDRILGPRMGMMAARRSTSKNNLKQIGLAMHNYYESKSQLPPGGTFDQTGQPQHSWATYLLPYLDQAELYEQIDLQQPWTAEANRKPFETIVHVFLNPGIPSDQTEEQSYQPSHYAVNSRMINANSARTFKEVRDGTSSTILAGEVMAGMKAWGDPANMRDPAWGVNQKPHGFGGPFKGGAHFLMVDGAARFISEDIDPAVLKALSTPNGGETVGEF